MDCVDVRAVLAGVVLTVELVVTVLNVTVAACPPNVVVTTSLESSSAESISGQQQPDAKKYNTCQNTIARRRRMCNRLDASGIDEGLSAQDRSLPAHD